MKILCVSDHVDPLVYSTSAKKRFQDIDLVLSAGDLPMEYLGFIASTLNKPVIFVFGNHNLKQLNRFKGKLEGPALYENSNLSSLNFFGSTYTGGRVITINGVIIAGFGGSRHYSGGANQFTERQMYFKIIRMLPRLFLNKLFHGRYLDILLTHAAPYGLGDKPDRCHRGFRAFLWIMEKLKPKFLIHGHIHLYDMNAKRETRYFKTQVINVYDHYILEYKTER